MDSGIDTRPQNGLLDKSADVELRLNNDDAILGTSVEEVSHIGQIEQVGQNSASMEVEGDEPYVGQEFESEAAAHAFYNAYALRVGFRTRVNDLSRSRVDGSVIARTLVCNKEGYRVADKRDRKSIRPRPPTRVGCKAMISMKKLSNGNWVVAKFVKEHAHSLTPGKSQNGLNDESSVSFVDAIENFFSRKCCCYLFVFGCSSCTCALYSNFIVYDHSVSFLCTRLIRKLFCFI